MLTAAAAAAYQCSLNCNCCNQGCTITNGSYYCTCDDGYLLNTVDNCICEGTAEYFVDSI